MAEAPPEQQVTTLPAYWALRSKDPGRAMEYGIVHHHGDDRLAEELVRAGVTGNPEQSAPGRPDAYPWLAFVPHRTVPVLSCMATQWTDRVDGTRRQIAPARLVYVPYEEAAAVLPTCRSLAAALLDLPWEGVDEPPAGLTADGRVALRLPAPDPAGLAAAVERCGFPWTAYVAGVLVEGGTVAIVADAEDFPSLADRLDVLDAVLALLPYWFRATIGAATWANPQTGHGLRLTFSTRARTGQTEARLGALAETIRLTSEDAVQYVTELFHAARDGTVGVAGLIRHLAACRRLPAEAGPGRALEELREARLAELVHQQIRAGLDVPGRVAEVLARGWDLLDAVKRSDFTRWLVDRANRGGDGQTVAFDTLDRHWQREMNDILHHWVRESLLAGDTLEARERLRRIAAATPTEVRAAESILERLLEPGSVAPQSLVGLLVEEISGVNAGTPSIAAAILGAPDVCRHNLLHLLRTTPGRVVGHIIGLANTVDGRVPAWFRPLLAVARADSRLATEEDVTALLGQWRDTGGSLLVQIAEHRGEPEILASGPLWPALIHHVAGLLPENGAITLPELTVTDPGDAARADLATLVAAGRMPHLTRYPAEPPADYLGALSAGWRHPVFTGARTSRMNELVRGLLTVGGDPARICAVGDTLGEPALTTAIVADLARAAQQARPGWLDLPESWAERVAEHGGLGYFGPLLRVREMSGSRSRPGEMARVVADAGTHGARVIELLPMISTWTVRWEPERQRRDSLYDVLLEIGGGRLQGLAGELSVAILRGAIGPELAGGLDQTFAIMEARAEDGRRLREEARPTAASSPPASHPPPMHHSAPVPHSPPAQPPPPMTSFGYDYPPHTYPPYQPQSFPQAPPQRRGFGDRARQAAGTVRRTFKGIIPGRKR